MVQFSIFPHNSRMRMKHIKCTWYCSLLHHYHVQYSRISFIGFSFLVQLSGNSALKVAKSINSNQSVKENLAIATKVVQQCSGIMNLIKDACSLMEEEKYCTVLRRMEDIEKQLANLGMNRFVSFVQSWLANMNDQIVFSTREEMYAWLMNIRKASFELGSAAIRRYSLVSHMQAHDKDQSQTIVNPLCRKCLVSLEILQQAGSDKGDNPVQMKSTQEDDGRSILPLTFSVALMLQIKGMCKCQVKLSEEEMLECVPGFSYTIANAKLQAKEDEKLLDNITSHCYPVHRAVHVFHSLDMLDDFYRWYVDNRLPMAELHSMIMHDLDNLDVCGFLTCLSTLASCIAGFFIVESTLQQKVKHKAGILTCSELQEAWIRCQNSLSDLILQHMQNITKPTHFIQVKETLVALMSLGIDLNFDTQSINLLLNELLEKFGHVLYVAFKTKCKCVFEDEIFEPMVVESKEEFEATIGPFNLYDPAPDNVDKSFSDDLANLSHTSLYGALGGSKSKSTLLSSYDISREGDSGMPYSRERSYSMTPRSRTIHSSPNELLNGNMYDQILGLGYESSFESDEFPLVMPFSKTVPLLSIELLKMTVMMLTFVSYIDIRKNASSFTVKLSEMGIRAIGDLISEQLTKVSNTGYIFHVSQVSINCLYLARVPLAIKGFIQACLSNGLAMDVFEPLTSKDSLNDRPPTPRSYKRNAALEGLAGDARNSIVDLVIQKVDVLLDGMVDFVNWEPPSTISSTPHSYCEDVIAYLSTTFKQLEGLQTIARNQMLSMCIRHLSSAMLDNLLGPDVAFVNSYALHHLQIDVKAIEEFATMSSGDDLMKNSMSSISQLLDAVLENKESVLIDEKKRAAKYPALDVSNLLKLYLKVKDVRVASQIKNTVGNELHTQLNEYTANRIRSYIKARGYETAGNEQTKMPSRNMHSKAKATRR